MALLFAQLSDVHRYVTPEPPQHAGAQAQEQAGWHQGPASAQSAVSYDVTNKEPVPSLGQQLCYLTGAVLRPAWSAPGLPCGGRCSGTELVDIARLRSLDQVAPALGRAHEACAVPDPCLQPWCHTEHNMYTGGKVDTTRSTQRQHGISTCQAGAARLLNMRQTQGKVSLKVA